VGEGERMPAALIQPNFDFISEWGTKKGLTFTSNEALIKNEKVIERIEKEVAKANEQFAKWEKVKQFRLTPDVWGIDGGHLTPTMKLKRKIVKELYIDLYENIYRS
jgi:long-chain acyl-CoA synthetase